MVYSSIRNYQIGNRIRVSWGHFGLVDNFWFIEKRKEKKNEGKNKTKQNSHGLACEETIQSINEKMVGTIFFIWSCEEIDIVDIRWLSLNLDIYMTLTNLILKKNGWVIKSESKIRYEKYWQKLMEIA